VKISIIDYPTSNIENVRRYIKSLVCSNIEAQLMQAGFANLFIIPGVGAFDYVIKYLRSTDFDLCRLCDDSTNLVIGICLGLHLACSKSEEQISSTTFVNGFSLIKRNVVSIASNSNERKTHTGWSYVTFIRDLENLNGYYYFSHSYGILAEGETNELATVVINGRKYVAVYRVANFIGVQFHPELSGATGIKLFQSLVFNLQIGK